MIKSVKINNFKSIKEAELDCGRVNIFIGEPNSGKTNIIEGIGLLSYPYALRIEKIVRYDKLYNLFYENNIKDDVNIDFIIDTYMSDSMGIQPFNAKLVINFIDENYTIKYKDFRNSFDVSYQNDNWKGGQGPNGYFPVKYYEFKKLEKFDGKELSILQPPYGKNLLGILDTNKELLNNAKNIFENYGYKIYLDVVENKIDIVKFVNSTITKYPFCLLADTLQRILFYTAVIETNKDSTIVLDEPDVYLFPKYTKYLAERIAKYNSNQFFLTTHNPYFLLTLAEKTPEKDLRIFLTYFEDYQTKVKLLNSNEVLSLRDEDASLFFNLDKYKD
jgi:AAA15 family ATPase/GTPase